jgi:DNA-directed RNA polymerase subunit alpha
MPALADFDLRQVVISNSMFGPAEIRQISQAVSADYNNFRALRDATNELAQQTGRSPGTSSAVTRTRSRP